LQFVHRIERGFHVARDDLKPARAFVVHAGDDRFPIADGVEAIGVAGMMGELAALAQTMTRRPDRIDRRRL